MNVPGLPYLNAQIDEMLLQQDSVLTIAQEFMRDTSIPLEDRWNVYLKVEKLLPVRSYFGEAIRELTDDIYDDVFPDGRGVRYNSAIDESILENHDYWSNEHGPDDDWEAKARASSATEYKKRDKWREAVLKEQQGLIVFDW